MGRGRESIVAAQSTSKPITYTLSLEELGAGVVHKYQGREPSGRMFNEIVLDHDGELLRIGKPNTLQKYNLTNHLSKERSILLPVVP